MQTVFRRACPRRCVALAGALAAALLAGPWPAGANAPAPGLYLHDTHDVSGRSAVLEDDGHVAYLYLTAPGSFTPQRHVVVYSRRKPVDRVDWWELRMTGETAPLWREIASRNAILAQPREADFRFRWSADGQAVAIVHRDQPLAFLTTEPPHGHSKAVQKASALGLPWNQRRFDDLFAR
jgi:hypothetical protein